MTEIFETDFIAEIKEFHQKFVRPYKGNPKGSSSRQIDELEKNFGFELPLSYKQYLAFMGNDHRGVFVGCDWFAKDVIENTKLVPDLLAENEVVFNLPENYLCFFSHQGYMAAWFELPKLNDNPQVWFFNEGSEMTEPIIEGVFTEFLLEDMRGLASVLPKLRNRI